MHNHIFTELSHIIAIGALVALVMRMLKQPLIVGHIIAGIIVGPSVLDIIQSQETVEAFSTLGISLLLFIIGLGLNPKVVNEFGKVTVITGAVQIGLTLVAGLLLSISAIVGLGGREGALTGLAVSFSSTIIILKLISDKREQTRLYGKIAIGLLLIQDVVATLALLFLSASSGGGLTAQDFGVLTLKGAGIGLLLWLIGSKILPRLKNFVASSQEFLFLFALGWGFGVATLFEFAGFSVEVGSLFAGVALAGQQYSQEISSRLKPIRDFFIIVFFIGLGASLELEGLSKAVLPALALSGMVMILKPVVVMSTLGLMGYTKRTSFKAGISMAQISEFSLIFIVLAHQQGFVSAFAVSTITLTALITFALSSYLITYNDQIYNWLESNTKMFEARKLGHEQVITHSYSILLFGFQKGGNEFLKAFRKMKKSYAVVDYDPEVIDHLDHRKINYIYGDATDIELLDELNIDKTKLIISTITDHKVNKFLVTQIKARNPNALVILQSESPKKAADLYDYGATYVMLPHYTGIEKLGRMLSKNGFNKTQFVKMRDKHSGFLRSA